jgi:hypothetical protein
MQRNFLNLLQQQRYNQALQLIKPMPYGTAKATGMLTLYVRGYVQWHEVLDSIHFLRDAQLRMVLLRLFDRRSKEHPDRDSIELAMRCLLTEPELLQDGW